MIPHPRARRTAGGHTSLEHPVHTVPKQQENPELAIVELRERAQELEKRTRTWIRANPTTALVGAVALGFVVGRLVMR